MFQKSPPPEDQAAVPRICKIQIYCNVLFSIEQVQLVYLIRNVLVDVYNSMCCSLFNKQQCISDKERMNRCIYFYLLFSSE